ncbi:MAG: thiamine diphosphokinase [Candidatus Limnocylindria bacterium]
MKAVVVAHGDVDPRDRAQLEGADLIVAADGGTLALEGWGVAPHAIVGDLDSLGMERVLEYGARGVTVVPFSPEKDESDLELAIGYATEAKADDIVLLAVFGGARFDHELANTLLIAADEYRGTRLVAVRGDVTVRALHGGEQLRLAGAAGDLVTLLPVRGDAQGVHTHRLRYPLAGETLHFGAARGLSNVVVSQGASVACDRGVLLVIETRGGGVS